MKIKKSSRKRWKNSYTCLIQFFFHFKQQYSGVRYYATFGPSDRHCIAEPRLGAFIGLNFSLLPFLAAIVVVAVAAAAVAVAVVRGFSEARLRSSLRLSTLLYSIPSGSRSFLPYTHNTRSIGGSEKSSTAVQGLFGRPSPSTPSWAWLSTRRCIQSAVGEWVSQSVEVGSFAAYHRKKTKPGKV